MKYITIRFLGQSRPTEVIISTGKSYKDATKVWKGDKRFNVLVLGKEARIYKAGKQMKGQPRIFEIGKASKYGILLMVGTETAMTYYFKSKKERDETFRCAAFESAKCASHKEQLNVIIACLEGTSGTLNGLMSGKTLKTSATSATPQGAPTLSSIVKTFIADSAKSTAKSTWQTGSETSPSTSKKSGSKKAMVLELPDHDYELGVNETMKSKFGQVITVWPETIWGWHEPVWSDGEYLWKKEWLKFVDTPETKKEPTSKLITIEMDDIYAEFDKAQFLEDKKYALGTVKGMEKPMVGGMEFMIGKTFWFEVGSTTSMTKDKQWIVPNTQIDFVNIKAVVKKPTTGQSYDKVSWVSSMDQYDGMRLPMEYISSMKLWQFKDPNLHYPWLFLEEWILTDSEDSNG